MLRANKSLIKVCRAYCSLPFSLKQSGFCYPFDYRRLFLFNFSKYIWNALFLLFHLTFIKVAIANEEIPIRLSVWHSFTESTAELEVYNSSIEAFESKYPNIDVESINVPYAQLVQKFITASQGGESPDIIRVTSQEIAKIGNVSVSGLPLLEDLSPHYTPIEKRRFRKDALKAMQLKNKLYALPASQSTLTLIYNKELFDKHNLPYPNIDWDLDDLIAAAKQLTNKDTFGLSIPYAVFLWWAPFHLGFDGQLFDRNGKPAFNSKATTKALKWLFNLEKTHQVVAPGKGYNIENVKNSFLGSKVAMIIDGSWNWTTYQNHGLKIGQSLLPLVSKDKRISPLLYYFGWSVSKGSANKIEASLLAQWLSSKSVQKEFALKAFTLPTIEQLENDPQLNTLPAFSGFMQQVSFGFPAPTTKGMSLIIKPVETAIELSFTRKLEPEDAFKQAEQELNKLLELNKNEN